MTRLYIFADETGDFEFVRGRNVSRYFILCTVSMGSCYVGTALVELRRRLAWDGHQLGDYFHATTDKQAVRDAVFEVIRQYQFSVQATIMEKSKAQPQVRSSRSRFYQYGWYYHFKYGAKFPAQSELLMTAASIGTKKERASFTGAVDDVMRQTIRGTNWITTFCPAAADPCLQVADYCAWALQRKWEKNDIRSYELIRDRINYEYDLWSKGTVHYY
jgi:Protein of unknown function (DUF3800)